MDSANKWNLNCVIAERLDPPPRGKQQPGIFQSVLKIIGG